MAHDAASRDNTKKLRLEHLPADLSRSINPVKSVFLSWNPPAPAALPATEEEAGERPTRELLPKAPAASEWPVEQSDAAPPTMLAISTQQGPEKFLLQRMIARGGFGEVWEATQNSLGRAIAVKKLRADLHRRAKEEDGNLAALEYAFRQEALTAAGLEHPNIVPVHDLVDEQGRQMLAMKMVRGRAWHEIIHEDFYTLAEREFYDKHLPILVSVCQAVAFAHSRGIVHRDLKPAQVMVGEFGEVQLMDWGLAIVWSLDLLRGTIADEWLAMLPTTESGDNPAGTVVFMAPEQMLPTAQKLGPWTDVYLLGGILYYLLTKAAPHESPDREKTLQMAEYGVVPLPHERQPARIIPKELAELAMQAMAADVKERIRSAPEFLARVKDYLTGASRRRESEAIAAEAARKLDASREDYEELNQVLALVERAAELWPDNPALASLRQRITGGIARRAVELNDLALARMQAEHLSEGALRNLILADISSREAQNSRRERQRRLGLVAVAAVPLLLGAGFYIQLRANSQANVAEQRLKTAIAEADSARREREQQEKRAASFAELNRLREREAALADRMARALPGWGALGQTERVRADSLLVERRALKERLAALGTALGSAATREPVPLMISEGKVRYALGEVDVAQELFAEAARLAPDRPEPELGLGRVAQRRGDAAAAKEHFGKARTLAAEFYGSDSPEYREAAELAGAGAP